MELSRNQILATGFVVVVVAGASLGALALGRSSVRASRPAVTISAEAPADWQVTAPDGANGRSEPGFAADVVHRFGAGDVVSATGRLADVQDESWREVRTPDGDNVWVRTALLGGVGGTPPTTPPVTTPPVTAPPVTAPPVTAPPVTAPPTTAPPTTVPPRPVFDTERAGSWDVTGVASGASLNVRSGPGTSNAVVARLGHDATAVRSTGNIATVSGVLWRQVEYRTGSNGWVNASFLKRHVEAPVFGTEPPGQWDVTGLSAGGSLNVRSGPGTSNGVVFRFAHNTTDIGSTGRIATASGSLWREVTYNEVGLNGWVSARFLKAHVPPPAAPTPVFVQEARGLWDVAGVTAGSFVSVRSQPGTTSEILAQLPHDATAVSSTGSAATLSGSLWRQVEYASGAAGWVIADHLVHHQLPQQFATVLDQFLAARIAGTGAEDLLSTGAADSYATSLKLYASYTESKVLKTRSAAGAGWEADIRLTDAAGTETLETITLATDGLTARVVASRATKPA